MRKLVPLLAAVVVVVALVAGVRFLRSGPPLRPLDGRPLAPTFILNDLAGVPHHLESYRGKVVLVNFWATWCRPCREELPALVRAEHALAKQGVVVLAVNVGESTETVKAFLAKHPLDFPVLLDSDLAVSTSWGVHGYPATFVLDPQGREAYLAEGARHWDAPAIIAEITALAGPAGKP